MPSTIDIINQPILPSNNPAAQNKFEQPNPQMQNTVQQAYNQAQNNNEDIPKIVTGGFHFSTKKEDEPDPLTITVEQAPVQHRKKKSKKKSDKNELVEQPVGSSEIIRAEGEVEPTPTINTYNETALMLKTTMAQIDNVSNEIKIELDNVKNSRTMKSKYNVMVGLAGNLSDLLEAKVSAIKELNNCITKANDMDYKREKDRKSAEQGIADDKQIMDLYTAFVQSPGNAAANNANANPYMTPIGPTPIASSVSGMGIVRAPADQKDNNQTLDAGYANYLTNLTPEMNQMIYEQNPDIKQCVVFDAATGNKWFQVMNVKTGQVVPNAEVHDQMFMEDTTLDLKKRIAKNNNLHETYPLVIINEQNVQNY